MPIVTSLHLLLLAGRIRHPCRIEQLLAARGPSSVVYWHYHHESLGIFMCLWPDTRGSVYSTDRIKMLLK